MKIGRNDLCPCGSGLKYKKCCLNKKQITEDEKEMIEMLTNGIFNLHEFLLRGKEHIKKYKRLRKIHSEILDSMLNYYETGKYDFNKELNNATKSIIKELNGDASKFKFASNNEEDMNILYNILIYKHHSKMTSLTEEYLNKNKFRVEEKVKMLQAMNNAYTGLFEIVNKDSENGYVEIEEVFTKKRFRIVDISLSMEINSSDVYLYNKIITYEDISFNTGLHLFFKKDDKEILEYIKNYNKNTSELIRCLDLYDIYKKAGVKVQINNIK